MARGIAAATKTALQGDSFRLATLITFGFDTLLHLTDYGTNVTVGATTYTASSHIVSIGGISESTALQVGSFELTLSGVEQSFINLLVYGNYLDVSVTIDRAVLDSSNLVIGSPFTYFEGRIVGYEISDDDSTSEVKIELASHWKDFEKVNCRRTNSNSQKRYFPNDTGFDFASKSIKDLKWGRK